MSDLIAIADLRRSSQLFDVNEAFAAQWLSVQKELGLPNEKTNVFGGAIGEPQPYTTARGFR